MKLWSRALRNSLIPFGGEERKEERRGLSDRYGGNKEGEGKAPGKVLTKKEGKEGDNLILPPFTNEFSYLTFVVRGRKSV